MNEAKDRVRVYEPTDEEMEGRVRKRRAGSGVAQWVTCLLCLRLWVQEKERDGECELEKCPHGQMT